MNHWYTADAISSQHRADLDLEAAKVALAQSARRTISAPSGRRDWRRRTLLGLLTGTRFVANWLEARLAA